MMFQAFVLGFWTLWSSDRDIHAVSESLGFMIVAVLIGMGMAFELPRIDTQWSLTMAILWAYVACVFVVVNRLASGFMGTAVMSAVAALGYYFLSEQAPVWVAEWMT